jgi:hypothetical protein
MAQGFHAIGQEFSHVQLGVPTLFPPKAIGKRTAGNLLLVG